MSKYRLALIQSFVLPKTARHPGPLQEGSKERLNNYDMVKHLLDEVEWDLIPGPLATYGDWAVENRQEFCLVGAGRLPIVKEVCESGKYNAIVLIGGGEPGAAAAKEIGRRYRIPVIGAAFAQMHVATMLGHKFSVIDLAESHNMYYYDLVLQHRMQDRCASIRSINYPHPRPPYDDDFDLRYDKAKAKRGEPSKAVDDAVEAAVAASEEDGADVITFGCSGTFWLQPFVQKRLDDMGWEVPVLEGLSCAITLAKLMVDLGVDASGLMFPGDRPKRWRRKKTF